MPTGRRVHIKLMGKCSCSKIVFWMRGAIPNDKLLVGHGAMIKCPSCEATVFARVMHVFEMPKKTRNQHEPAPSP